MRILMNIRETLLELPSPDMEPVALRRLKHRIIRQVSRYFDEAAESDIDGMTWYAAAV